MKLANIWKFIYLLSASNLLFVGSYAFLAIHALFLHDPQFTEQIKTYIILGMSVFGATQVGGFWLLSLVNDRLSTSIVFLTISRLVGIGLLIIPNGWAIVASLLAFGLSHAAYYKTSRIILSNLLKDGNVTSSKAYFLFSLTTNVAFLILPFLGSKFLLTGYSLWIGSLISIILATISIIVLIRLMRIVPVVSVEKAPELLVSKANTKEFFKDVLRFAGFVLPYTIMIAIIPIKTSEAGLPAVYNSVFLGFNSAIIILFQVLGLKFKIAEYSTWKYDTCSVIASFLTFMCLFANIWVIVPLFILWSICESYQMPNLEYHLFSKRTYSSKSLNNILALDALFCFLGPIIASANLYTLDWPKFETQSEELFNKIVNYFT